MENTEFLSLMQDKIELAVANGMQAHRKDDHDPVWKKINDLQSQVDFWKGAVWVVGIGFTLLLAVLEAFKG